MTDPRDRSTTAAALYVRDGDVFHPTELTRSFWGDDVQHGSPPAGLFACAVEKVPTAKPMQVVRLTIDLFRPVPATMPVAVRTTVVRDGRRIQVVDAELTADGRTVARASALKIRSTEVPVPSVNEQWSPPPDPESLEPMVWDSHGYEPSEHPLFHTHAIDVRTVGGSFLSPGRGIAWVRIRVPLVAGEETTPFTHAAALADVGNGVSMALDGRRWSYVNPDLSITLHRLPQGRWVGIESVAHQHRTGIGSAESLLFDEVGPIGRATQSQILEPRTDSRTT